MGSVFAALLLVVTLMAIATLAVMADFAERSTRWVLYAILVLAVPLALSEAGWAPWRYVAGVLMLACLLAEVVVRWRERRRLRASRVRVPGARRREPGGRRRAETPLVRR